MALTRPRASQIYNLDYKQATRVVSIANVTLAGGAPSLVDGVTLSLNDRILVTGQSTGSQNGIYYVSTLGSGSNGTWTRSTDDNGTSGVLDAGTIIMVTEGSAYADTQWKLTTDNPITIGVTALTFVQNYSANSISSGTSNVSVTSNANVTISAAGTANVLTVSSTGTIVSGTESVTGNITGGNIRTAGLISATGNVTGNYILGNGALLTGVITSVANINSGNSNVTVTTANGNITVGVGGTNNVAVFATTGEYVTGVVSATGNITGNYFIGNGSQLTGISASGSGVKWTTANTAPSSPAPGDFWYAANTSVKYQYTNDGTANYWVDQSYPTSFSTLAVTGNATTGNISTSTATVGNIVNSNANGVGNIGSSSLYFNTVFAKATSAQYADLAEMYVADQDYAPGTVVEFGGDFEVTASSETHTTRAAGVISTNPSYLMNAVQDGTHVLPVALTGRVPCRVIGKISKGDRLVASPVAGVAQVLESGLYEPGCIIGKALESYDSIAEGVIEIAVGRY